MPLGGVAIVDWALREGEAVMGAGIDLDLVVRSLHVEGKIAPLADIETIETELMLADLDSLEKLLPSLAEPSSTLQT